METGTRIVLLLALWGVYALLHSLLASLQAKRFVAAHYPRLMPFYRLGYNAIALILLLPPLYLTWAWRGPLLWQWSGPLLWLANGLALLAVAGFFWTLRYYSGAEFLGLSQAQRGEKSVRDQEHFSLSPLHRYVRHPWYALGLVIIWSRDMDAMFLATACIITLYFVVGSRLEERKLISYHGEVYREYRKRVPGLVPLPWRYLNREQERQLLAMSRAKEDGKRSRAKTRLTAKAQRGKGQQD
jgi:protein-S-isoprenylcysteine O-methyltransferase Ste14